MPDQINLYEPRTLIGVTERMAPVHTFLRTTFFSRVETFQTESVDVDFVKGNRQVAPFVHPRIGGKVIENKGYQTNSYKPPLIAPDIITTADDLMKRLPGEHIYSGKSPAERAAEKLGKDLSKLDEMVTRREEWMCAQALFKGQIPIIGDGIDEVIEFDFTNKETLSGVSLWSNADADILGDIERWYEDVQVNGFINPNIAIVSSDVANVIINSKAMKELLDVKAYDLAVIAPKQLPNGATFIGRIHKLNLDIYQYNEWFLDDWTDPDKPKTEPLVPAGTFGLFSTNADYAMYYGSITLIDEASNNFTTVEGRRVPDTWVRKKPAAKFLSLQSRPLPVPHEVNSWFIATVL